jgi:hypothetical protein
MTTINISIAKDFSRYPAGRFVDDGPYPGELCRNKLLVPALQKHEIVTVDLDGTLGYGSSFLEETFGGLVRVDGFTSSDLHKRLQLVAKDKSVVEEIWSYVDSAVKQ